MSEVKISPDVLATVLSQIEQAEMNINPAEEFTNIVYFTPLQDKTGAERTRIKAINCRGFSDLLGSKIRTTYRILDPSHG